MHTDWSPGDELRRRMDAGCVAAPGAFNALAARAIAKSGFEACYVSGAAASVCAGLPDVGLLTLDHFVALVRQVADAARTGGKRLPVMADADTGFGEEEMVRRTVVEYARAGAAGLHIEDQVFPKRCGHLEGKTLLPVDQAAGKIEWAVAASRDCSGGSFIVCARTDARGVDGFDAAADRARAYIHAGASMIFPEGLTGEDEFARFAEIVRAENPGVYLLANMTEFGKTPIIPFARFAEMGYHLVIYPVTLLRSAMGAVDRALDVLKCDGHVGSLLDSMQTREELYSLIDYEPGRPWPWPA